MAKISEITIRDIKDIGKIEYDDDDIFISTILTGAIMYIKNHTGLSLEDMDSKEDLTIALLVICNDLYENRQFTVSNDKINPIAKSILDMHCVNLL